MNRKFEQTNMNMNKLFPFSKLKKAIVLSAIVFFNLNMAFAQDSTLIKGVVMSPSKQPLENVSVSIVRSVQLPVLTNEAGEFSLRSSSGSNWLIISPTGGYKVKKIFLNNMDKLSIYLTPDELSSGDDEFSILEQPFKRRNLSVSVSEIKTENFHHTSAMSIDQFMQGRVAGLNVIMRSGMPASGAVTTLRGINSLYATNQPLYVVDGIPMSSQDLFNSNLDGFEYNPIMAINPLDISEINIVKDPSITSLYGSKASNGVIFIQTLDPSATQTVIELDYKNGFSLSPSNKIPQLNGVQHKTLMSELLLTAGDFEEDIRESLPILFLEKDDVRYIDYQHNTNWQDLVFDNALFTNMNLNVKGGDEIARYGLSFGYTDSKGIIKTTDFKGYNLRFVSRLNVFTWLKMVAGVSLNYNFSSMKEAATVGETSPILTSLAKSPLLNPYKYDFDGKMLTSLSEVDELGISNPLATIQKYEATNSNFNFVSTLGVEGLISDNLTVKSNFNLTYNVLKELIFMPNRGMELYYDDEAINVSKLSNNDLNSFYNNTYLIYEKDLGENHHISSNSGINIMSNKYQFDWGLTKNAHENDEYRMIQDGQNNQREIGGENRLWNWVSFYEYITYAYKDKYLLSASISVDGSSRVGDNAANTISIGNVPLGLFYGASAAWRLSNESFMQDQTWLEDLKFRVSFGKSGNDDIGEANATNYYQSIKFRETVGLYPATIPNDELTYETVSQMDVGLDIALYGNKFTASFDIFRSSTDNMIIYSPMESFLGYDLRIENGGEMVNKGWEFNTFLRIIDKETFKWDVYANVASFKNEITKIPGGQLSYEIPGAEKINMLGAPANSFYGYIYNGVYATQAEAEAAGLVNDKGIAYSAGDAIYEDISGPNDEPDNIINFHDKTTIGSSQPKIYGGLTNTFTYKRWSVSALLQFVYGVDLFNYVRYQNESMTTLANQSTAVLSRWQYDGHVTNVPRALWNDPMGNSAFSTRWMEDGSYLRVRNISISYKIPEKFLAFRNAEFYLSANNIFTFTNYLGYDPEFAYGHSQIYQGVDYGQTPQPRQFIAGIRLGF